MTTRRGFIGTILGTFVASQLPFVAKAAQPKRISNGLFKLKRLVRAFELSVADVKDKYRLVFVTDSGVRAFAPPLAEVKRDDEKLVIQFIAEELNLTSTISMKGVVLVDEDETELKVGLFSSIVNMVNGDRLKVTYTLDASTLFQDPVL